MSFIDSTTAIFNQQIVEKNGPARFIRESAFEAFLQRGLPTRRVENWRYTPLRLLEQLSDEHAVETTSIENLIHSIPETFHRVVIKDGVYAPELSDYVITWLTDPHPAQINPDKHPMAVLNLAMTQGGLELNFEPDTVLDKPLAVIHLSTAQSAGKTHHIHHRIKLGHGAKATVVMHYLSTGKVSQAHNVLVHAHLDADATLQYLTMNTNSDVAIQIEGLHVEQQARSTLDAFVLSTGSRLSRIDINTAYLGERAIARMSGIYSLNDRQHTDIHMNAEHVVGHCSTYQSVRGVVDHSAKAVFNGRVCVHQHAAKSFSEQSNHNLILSATAEVDAKPELEIYHDDVKCAHGATIGQLDREALFYLMARGISEEDALTMLRVAFIGQQFDLIEDPDLREYVRGMI